jgi:uncharacterized membrane protein YhaH (DUF805 family)
MGGSLMINESAATSRFAWIRGWLLVFCVMLVPHIVSSALLLMAYGRNGLASGGAPPRLEVLQLTLTLVGHSVGLALILARSRYAPAYFVLYTSLLLLLVVADPDPTATYVRRLHAMGASREAAEDHTRAVRGMVVSLAASAVALGYWVRSERVMKVFGSTGLQIFRRHSTGSRQA